MLISSRANERVKHIRSLRDKKERDAGGTFFAEGERLVRAALELDAVIEQVVVAPGRIEVEGAALLDALAEKHLPVLEVTPDVFDSLSFREESQAIGIVVRQRWESLAQVTQSKRCWVALPDIQHPGNLGTIIRNCDAIGGDGVILPGPTTDPYHPIAVRGSLGAVFSQRIVKCSEPEFTRWLRRGGCTVVGTSPAGDRDYREVDYASKPIVLLMGSERTGLSTQLQAMCDHLVRIPMAGYVESLNLSIAAALVLYEVLRQREDHEMRQEGPINSG